LGKKSPEYRRNSDYSEDLNGAYHHIDNFYLISSRNKVSNVNFNNLLEEIGENLHKNFIKKLERDNERKLRDKELELRDFYDREKRALLESETKKWLVKQDILRASLKKQYQQLLEVDIAFTIFFYISFFWIAF
jgi:hypothetical protein